MKKLKVSLVALALMAGATANAQGLSDILKGLGGAGGDVSSTIGNLIEGVFSKSDITLEDLVGDYVSTGPAVTFKSDNFCRKQGVWQEQLPSKLSFSLIMSSMGSRE